MEHRAFASAFGVLAAALVVVGPQSSAADPSGIQEKDDGWTKTAEAGVSVVSKMLRAAPPTASKHNPLGVGFGMSSSLLEPLPLSGEDVLSMIVMATPPPTAAATPAPAAAAARAVTPKPKHKPVVQEPPGRLSWLRLPWWRR
jgi:hypothetical protein